MDLSAETWLYALASVILVSLLSVIGAVFISIRERNLKQIVFVLVSLAVGSLFGDVFIHLLPEAFEKLETRMKASLYLLAGIFIFFILEKFILWRHHTLVSLIPVAAGVLIFVSGNAVFDSLFALLIGAVVMITTAQAVVGSQKELLWPKNVSCGHSGTEQGI